MWLTSRILGHDREYHLAWIEILQAFFATYQLAVGRKDGRNPDQALRSNAGVTKCQFERSQSFLVLSHTLGEENLCRNHAFAQSERLQSGDSNISELSKITHAFGKQMRVIEKCT